MTAPRLPCSGKRLVLALAMTLSLVQMAAAQQAKPGYRLGERLPAAPADAKPAQTYRTVDWDALLPKGWDPAAELKGLDFATLKDGDPRAMEAMARMQEMWDNAPLNPALDNTRVRIAGFVVPLERRGNLIYEFLLVPYFGACIHLPPPPANQIIHVFPAKPVPEATAAEPVWISGAIESGRSKTNMGSAGYRLNADAVAPFNRKR